MCRNAVSPKILDAAREQPRNPEPSRGLPGETGSSVEVHPTKTETLVRSGPDCEEFDGDRHAKRPKTSGLAEIERLRRLLVETQIKLEHEKVFRRLVEAEAIQANKACMAAQELAFSFCETFSDTEREYERTYTVLRKSIADWEAWGHKARALLERNGLLAGSINGDDLEDTCSMASVGKCDENEDTQSKRAS